MKNVQIIHFCRLDIFNSILMPKMFYCNTYITVINKTFNLLKKNYLKKLGYIKQIFNQFIVNPIIMF